MPRIVFTNDFNGNRRMQDIPVWQAFNLLKNTRWLKSMTVYDGDGETTFTKVKNGKMRVHARGSE